MNICFVCSEYPPASHGGIGSATQALARALVNRGHQVRVVGVYRSSGAAAAEDDEGVQVWRLPMPASRFGWVAARYQVFHAVASWAREGLIDLVESPDWEGWVAGWPRLAVPVISRLHGSSSYFAAELRQRCRKTTFWLERAALRRSDYWCSVSRYTARKTRELFELINGPGTVIYNAVDVLDGQGPAPGPRSGVVFSGTLTEKKGIRNLIRAWPLVQPGHPGILLHVYGKDTTRPDKPSMRDSLRAELPEAVRASVVFHGHVPRQTVLNHLRHARVAVFPSYAEAFAMAPLEAMAQACPTVYSIQGSGPELIEDGKDGLLVDPASPLQIAAAIDRVLRDHALAHALGQAGREKVSSRFSLPQILRQNEEFYQDCLNRFRRRATM